MRSAPMPVMTEDGYCPNCGKSMALPDGPSPQPVSEAKLLPNEIWEWMMHMDLHLTEHDDRHAAMALRSGWPPVRDYFVAALRASSTPAQPEATRNTPHLTRDYAEALHEALEQPAQITCPRCYGEGPSADCELCKGSGYVSEQPAVPAEAHGAGAEQERLWDVASMLKFQAKAVLSSGKRNIEIDAEHIVPQIVAVIRAAILPSPAQPSPQPASEAGEIKRYREAASVYSGGHMVEKDNGEWVRYEDHIAALRASSATAGEVEEGRINGLREAIIEIREAITCNHPLPSLMKRIESRVQRLERAAPLPPHKHGDDGQPVNTPPAKRPAEGRAVPEVMVLVPREPTLEARKFLEGRVGVAWITGWRDYIATFAARPSAPKQKDK